MPSKPATATSACEPERAWIESQVALGRTATSIYQDLIDERGFHVVQAWFPGAHSDVGGSNTPDGLANEALHWIIDKAEQHGLAVDTTFLSHYTPCFNGELHDSLMYRSLGTLNRPLGGDPTETVHQATLDRLEDAPSAYNPSNLAGFLQKNASVVRRTQRGSHEAYPALSVRRVAP